MVKRAFWITGLFTIALSISLCWWTPSASAFTEDEKILLQAWRIVNQSYVDDTFNHQNWWFMRQKFLQEHRAEREETYDAIEKVRLV